MSADKNEEAQPKGVEGVELSIVGDYQIGKTLGEGTFGKVKIGIHIPTGEQVAIKVLEKIRIKEPADIVRVKREIKILKKVKHQNVIQLFEVIDTKEAIYLVMEYTSGGEMFDFIVSHKHVQEKQACKFFHQIVDGLDEIHKSEVTHRDLKPENLLLKPSPQGWMVKIVDFGLGNLHEGGRLLSTACGSPCYAAPEMIAGKKYQGPIVDIWSLGVVLFALVAGFLPFEDPNTSALYKKILGGDYKPPKFISSEVKDLIKKILETDPRRRYSLDQIRAHAWYQLISETSVPRETVSEPDKVLLHLEVLSEMETKGIAKEGVMEALRHKTFNSVTATYYLFEQKFRGKYIVEKRKADELKETRKKAEADAVVKTPAPPSTQRPGINRPAAVESNGLSTKSVNGRRAKERASGKTEPARAGPAGSVAPVLASVDIADGLTVMEGQDTTPANNAPDPTLDLPSTADPKMSLPAVTAVVNAKRVSLVVGDTMNDDSSGEYALRPAEGSSRPTIRARPSQAAGDVETRNTIIERLLSIQPQLFGNQQQQTSEQQVERILSLQQRYTAQKMVRGERKPHRIRAHLDASAHVPMLVTAEGVRSGKDAGFSGGSKAPSAILSLLKLKYPKFHGETTKVTIQLPKSKTGELKDRAALEAHTSLDSTLVECKTKGVAAPPQGDRSASRPLRQSSLSRDEAGSATPGVSTKTVVEPLPPSQEKSSVAVQRAHRSLVTSNASTYQDDGEEQIRAVGTTESEYDAAIVTPKAAPQSTSVISSLLASIIS